jgi:hypothetical protein
MTIAKLALMLVCLMSVTLGPKAASKEAPAEAQVSPLFSKDLTNLAGKEGLMITVVYPPGARILSIAITRMRLFTSWRARS